MRLQDILEQTLGLEGRKLEDELYKLVWEEISQGQLNPSAQARAVADGSSSKHEVQAAYISHRVRMLKDEVKRLKLEQKKAAERDWRRFEAERLRAKGGYGAHILPEGFDEDLAQSTTAMNSSKRVEHLTIFIFCIVAIPLIVGSAVSVWLNSGN